MRAYKHWIDGAETRSSNEAKAERRSPFDGALLATFALGGAADVDAAVKAARTAFDHGPWRDLAGSERWRRPGMERRSMIFSLKT